jgi:hypothetical protein
MVMWRLIWGEKLENELKSEEPIMFDIIENCRNTGPFIYFKYREGKGWSPIDYNDKGWELYGASIMNPENK